jgi:hypothetical protein
LETEELQARVEELLQAVLADRIGVEEFSSSWPCDAPAALDQVYEAADHYLNDSDARQNDQRYEKWLRSRVEIALEYVRAGDWTSPPGLEFEMPRLFPWQRLSPRRFGKSPEER